MPIRIFEVQFDKSGSVFLPRQETDIISFLTTAPGNLTTDVVALSHGWNNGMDEARTLYRAFLADLEALLPPDRAAKVIAIGVLWPSKKFADQDLIPSGAAAFDPFEVLSPFLTAQVEQLKQALDNPKAAAQLDAVEVLLPRLENDAASQREFVAMLGALLAQNIDTKQQALEEGTISSMQTRDGAELLRDLSQPFALQPVDPNAGGAADLDGAPTITASPAAGLGELFNSVVGGASRLLNYFTYYVMKDRAGLVGRAGVNPMLSRIQTAISNGIRFHLAGHSFGGRLMTATVDGPNRLRVNALLLLQAAFSHNGFAHNYIDGHNGFFVQVARQRKVNGPILVTHSDKDEAVGLAYPLASRISGDTAAALGDATDLFGGIGRNGAQHMEDLAQFVTLLGARSPYPLAENKLIYNFNGDNVITSHGDVARPETAWLMAMQILA
jgi:pimeloyl-ACP methyl ester carboxylesterase